MRHYCWAGGIRTPVLLREQIYSLPPLTTRPPTRGECGYSKDLSGPCQGTNRTRLFSSQAYLKTPFRVGSTAGHTGGVEEKNDLAVLPYGDDASSVLWKAL